MLQIGTNTIVSLDVVERCFCCDLCRCHGACCVEGDAGAPVTDDEVKTIEDLLPTLWDSLSAKAQQVINQQGVSYSDQQGERVLSVVDGKECVFSRLNDDGTTLCVIDEAFRQNKTGGFQKPISCALYPIRLTEYQSFTAVNYHHWDICLPACQLGMEMKMPVYKFLREPLIRRFGKQWYDELDLVAQQWLMQKKRRKNK